MSISITPSVARITGTPNQIIASQPAGAVTLSLPQSIGTASNVTFGTVNSISLSALAIGFTAAGGSSNKTLKVSNSVTLAGTDGSTLNIGTGGTLGTNAFSSTAMVPQTRTINGYDLSFDRVLTKTDIGLANVANSLQLVASNNLSDLTNAATARTNIGATTTGGNILTLTNPGAITFLKINADSTVSAESAATYRTSLGLAIGTNVQAYDADLDALAALSGTNNIYYRSAANTWTAVTFGSGISFAGGTLSATGSGGVAVSGTPSTNQIAQWTDSSHIQGLAVTGSGNAVLATSPTITTPTIAKLANLTTNGFVKTSNSDGTLVVDTGIPLLGANNLSDVSNPATARTNLGVAIGTNVQAYDADLDALAALSGTNNLYYRSASNTWTSVSFTSPVTFGSGAISLSTGVDYAFTSNQTITYSDASTNSVPTVLAVSHNSVATPANGFGMQIDLKAKSSTTNNRLLGFIRGAWDTATDASRTAYLSFAATSLGTDASAGRFYMFGSGGASLYTKQDSGAGVFYVETGYQQGGTTPQAGHVLRSDGSKFVDAALAAADLSNGATGTGSIVLASSPTLTSPVLTTPSFSGTIGSSMTVHGNLTLTGTLDYQQIYSPDSQIDILQDNGLGIALSSYGWTTVSDAIELRTTGRILMLPAFGDQGGGTVPSGASAVLDLVKVSGSSVTVTGSTGITTATGFNNIAIYRPTYTDSSLINVTNAATVWIENAPLASGSLSITNPYALWVDAGVVRFDGGLGVGVTNQVTTGVVDASVGFRISGAATTGNVLRGNGTNFVSTQLAYSDLSGTPSGANPSASVGLSAVNGSSSNYMRADGAPALSQSIVPTWTGKHTFSVAPQISVNNATTNAIDNLLTLTHNSTGTAATGFGTGIVHQLETSTGATVDAITFQTSWTNASNAGYTSQHDIYMSFGGTPSSQIAARFSGAGGLSVGSTYSAGQGVINADQGITIAGAGTANYVLRGDGSMYTAKPLGGQTTKTPETDQTATTETAHITYTVPANAANSNTVYHIVAWGTIDNGTTQVTFTPRIRWGGTTGTQLLATPTIVGTTTAQSGKTWHLDANVVIVSAGASGSSHSSVFLGNHTANASGAYTMDQDNNVTNITIDTTAQKDLVLTWTMSTTTGSPHVRTKAGYIEVVRP